MNYPHHEEAILDSDIKVEIGVFRRKDDGIRRTEKVMAALFPEYLEQNFDSWEQFRNDFMQDKKGIRWKYRFGDFEFVIYRRSILQ